MSQQPRTPAANPKPTKPKRAIGEAISPSPSPSLRQPAKKKSSYNLPKGGASGGQRKQAQVNMFDAIEFKPHGTPASTMSTASPIVAPKKATSHVSASSVPLTGGLSQAVEDTKIQKTLW